MVADIRPRWQADALAPYALRTRIDEHALRTASVIDAGEQRSHQVDAGEGIKCHRFGGFDLRPHIKRARPDPADQVAARRQILLPARRGPEKAGDSAHQLGTIDWLGQMRLISTGESACSIPRARVCSQRNCWDAALLCRNRTDPAQPFGPEHGLLDTRGLGRQRGARGGSLSRLRLARGGRARLRQPADSALSRRGEQGDARGFVQALKARGYFTDNEASYTKSVQSLATLALRTGFDALGSGATRERVDLNVNVATTPMLADAPALAQAMLERLSFVGAPSASDAPLAGGALLGGDALLDRPGEYATLSVAPSAFADEVNRAALLMSALRIADPSERRSEG